MDTQKDWQELKIECRKDLNDIEMLIDETRWKLTQDILSLPALPYNLIDKEKELTTLQQEADCLNRILKALNRNIGGVES